MPPEKGKLRITVPEQTVEWTIGNFRAAIMKDNLLSQAFYFSKTRLFLGLNCVRNTGRSDGKLTLSLILSEFSAFDQRLNCELGIKKSDGSVFISHRSVEISSRIGILDFVQISEILEAGDVMTADDSLTFFCTLSTGSDGRKKDARCHTLSSVGLGIDAAVGAVSSECLGIDAAVGAVSPDCLGIDAAVGAVSPDYVGTLAESLKGLFHSGLHSDVTMKVKDVEFPAHKCILSARSPFFATMFLREMAEKSSEVVDVSDCDASCFEVFLLFLYTGDAGYVTAENAVRLYRIAAKYKTADLKKASVQILKGQLRVETICDVVQLAVVHDEIELLRVATDFFIDNCVTILTTPSWKVLLADNPSTANGLFLQFAKKHSRRE